MITGDAVLLHTNVPVVFIMISFMIYQLKSVRMLINFYKFLNY